jgi:hypothetical protein
MRTTPLLYVLIGARSGEVLSVELPFSEEAYQRMREARRSRGMAVGAIVAGFVVVLALVALAGGARVDPGLLLFGGLLVVCVGGGVAISSTSEAVHAAEVGVTLDASRRWVTLSGVHPDFAAAASDQRDRFTVS